LRKLVVGLATNIDEHEFLSEGSQRARQEAFQTTTPVALVCIVGNEVLPQFELDAGETASLAMLDERVVGRVSGGVRLVVTDNQIAFLAQCLQDPLGRSPVTP
jgi:hypothetical protein